MPQSGLGGCPRTCWSLFVYVYVALSMGYMPSGFFMLIVTFIFECKSLYYPKLLLGAIIRSKL